MIMNINNKFNNEIPEQQVPKFTFSGRSKIKTFPDGRWEIWLYDAGDLIFPDLNISRTVWCYARQAGTRGQRPNQEAYVGKQSPTPHPTKTYPRYGEYGQVASKLFKIEKNNKITGYSDSASGLILSNNYNTLTYDIYRGTGTIDPDTNYSYGERGISESYEYEWTPILPSQGGRTYYQCSKVTTIPEKDPTPSVIILSNYKKQQ